MIKSYHFRSGPDLNANGVFGSIAIVIADNRAVICIGKETLPDPDKRYIAGVANGFPYLVLALMSGAIITF